MIDWFELSITDARMDFKLSFNNPTLKVINLLRLKLNKLK